MSRSSSALRRELAPVGATLFTAGMIIGTGIFAASGAATAAAGTGILMAIVLGGTVALATGISAAQLGVNFPEEGGAFSWARAFDHDTTGFIAGCGYLGKALVSMSVVGLALTTYLAQAIPGLPQHFVAAVCVLVITGLNVFGIDLTSKIVVGLLAVTVALLAVYSGAALHAVDRAHLGPLLGDHGLPGVLAGAAIFFWSWDGFMRTAIMASEMKDPRRSIPLSIVGGVALAALVFVPVAAVTLGVLGADDLGREDAPLLAAAKHVADWTFWPVLAAAGVAGLGDMVGILLAASRVALAMGKAHEVPRWLAAVHPRFRTPHHAVAALGVASAALVLVFDLRALIETASAFMLVWYLVTHFAALQLPKAKRIASPIFSWYGIAACVALFVSLPVPAVLGAAGALAALIAARWLVRSRAQPAAAS
ncbi:MAG: amino acid permease [Chloroflexi bacterium]|nr:MAG: amino acid permease [Chloroflexota bacterium]